MAPSAADDPGQPAPLTDAAFELLFRSCHAPLCEVVHGYVRSRAVAEEIVQDLFLALWERGGADVRDARQYLFAAARNRALDHLRRDAVSRRWTLLAGFSLVPSAMAEPPAAADAALEREEEHHALERAVAGLPARTRLALVLRWSHGLSHAEVAAAMGISRKGVEKLLATAMRKLRIVLRASE